MRFIIKKMESEDEIKGKAFVHWKSWQEAYQGIVDSQYLAGMTLEQCEQTAYRWPDNILVAKDGDRVVGFAGYGKYRNAELEHAGEIYALYVLAEYYGKGIGAQLMNEALALLADYPKTAVWVLKDNSRAIAFYERFGFCIYFLDLNILKKEDLTENQIRKTALALLADYPKTAVWVLKDNSRATAFYERFGFCFDGREEILELGTPVTALRMILER